VPVTFGVGRLGGEVGDQRLTFRTAHTLNETSPSFVNASRRQTLHKVRLRRSSESIDCAVTPRSVPPRWPCGVVTVGSRSGRIPAGLWWRVIGVGARSGAMAQIDARSARLVHTVAVGNDPQPLARRRPHLGTEVTTPHGHRGGTAARAVTAQSIDSLDPAQSYFVKRLGLWH